MQDSNSNYHLLNQYVKIVLISIIAYWCFLIFRPFIVIIIWAMIIGIVTYPLYKLLSKKTKKKGLSAFLIGAILMLLVTIPSVGIVGSIVENIKDLSTQIDEGTLAITPPKEEIREWPLVGDQIFAIWSDASINLETAINKHNDQFSKVFSWFARAVSGLIVDVMVSIVALIVACFFLFHSESIYKNATVFFNNLTYDKGKEYTDMSRDTIMSVAKGLILIAVIQSVLSGLAFGLAGIPGAGIWAIVVLILAIIQLPVILLMIPLIVYVFAHSTTTVAIIFTVAAVVIGLLDNILKPVLLGRGLKIPMLVILIGAIGGMILHGIIGLFIGPVVLAIGWQSYQTWLHGKEDEVNMKIEA